MLDCSKCMQKSCNEAEYNPGLYDKPLLPFTNEWRRVWS